MPRVTSQEIDAVAAEWAARIDRGPLSPEDDKRLEMWLSADDRRRGAFMRMRAISLHTERAKALGANYDPKHFLPKADAGPRRISRRAVWVGLVAIAASGIGVVGLTLRQPELYETRIGETRIVTLEDGSVITLNTSSRIRVAFNEERRRVTLDEGEALFDVAKDKARPFVVHAGEAFVTAVGTSFTVKRLESAPVEVMVREGIVDVSARDSARPVRMAANTRMSATAIKTIAPSSISPGDISRELAWSAGRIAFEGDTLAQAAQTFARYSDTRIIIDDPDVAREEISGLFSMNDPVSFARAAAASLGLQATVGPGEVRLSR